MIGIAVSEFWEMTPAELNIYAETYAEKQKEEFKEKVALAYWNALWTIQWLGKKTQHPKPLDKILNSFDKQKEQKQDKKGMSPEQMLAQVKLLNKLFGGKVIDKTKK